MNPTPVPITVAHGDGIGPEIMVASLDILRAGGAQLDIEEIIIGEKMYGQVAGDMELNMISNRGQMVWPAGAAETLCTDHWRCRFFARGGGPVAAKAVIRLQDRLVDAGLEPIKTEGLFTFDGEAGYTKGQGQ